jgi:transcriptional regulator with XRE-family HTH domain
MPFHREALPTDSRQEFCLALKAARERKGITLAQIAASTKIPAYMFAALERNDLRRWPKGLFRRSFFKDYVRAIGLPVAETCEEFVRLFPDHEVAQPAKPAATNEVEQADYVRLVLDAAWHGPRASLLARLLVALIDAGVVLLASGALAWAARTDQLATIASVALTYFSLATAVIGESPAKWVMSRRQSIIDALAKGPTALASAWRRAADATSRVVERVDGVASETTEEPEGRTWITDAHRVASAPSPRLRVRFKA